MKLSTLKDLYIHELKSLFSAETQLVEALPKMAAAATSQDLKAAFEAHLLETKEHGKRLKEVLALAGAGTRGPKCAAMQGLIEEGSSMIEEEADPEVRDAGLVAAAQRVEHYEMAGYGTVCSFAKLLGADDAVLLLQATLNEEAATDQKLTDLAVSAINPLAHEGAEYESSRQLPRRRPEPKTAHTKFESLAGKRVVITGGTTGLGRAIALRLSAEGAKILIFGRHQAELDDALTDIRENDPDVLGLIADASKNEDLEKVFQIVDSEWGGLDVLVNNAGLSGDSLKDTPDEERELTLKTNINGYLTGSRLALDRMKEHSHIILVGSVNADEREPGGSIYVATKAAIQAFAESFRQEAAEDGIRVSLIQPGKTGSDMIEQTPEEQREAEENLEMLKAEDIAVAVEYILTQPRRCNVSSLTVYPARISKDE
ncbi:MAG: ferritin-like protein [Verrucomicrobiales bacterium]|nr:ferritin-like protein [Verrucomicrobiales bacterium]